MSKKKSAINDLLVKVSEASAEGDFAAMQEYQEEANRLHAEYWESVREAKKVMEDKKENKTFNANKIAEEHDIDIMDVASI